MIQSFQNLLFIEQIILGAYIVLIIAALIGFFYDGATHFGQMFKVVKSLLWPSWFFKMWGFMSREHESGEVVGAFLKGSIVFAYIPAAMWISAWIASQFIPLPGEYISFAMPMTISQGLALLGWRVVEIDFALEWLPLPLFFSKSAITMQGLSLGWIMANMLRLNVRADVLFKQRDFKGDFLRVLKAQNAYVEARENKMPHVRDTKRGEALVCTQGISLTAQKIKELAPILESNLGCWITGVERGESPDWIKVGYRYRPFPSMIKFEPEKHKHSNSRKVVIGTDMTQLIAHDFSKDAHVLISGKPNKGKTTALVVMCVSMFNQNPDTILIVIDPTKDAIDFGFLKWQPKEREEYLRGDRNKHDIHALPLVLVVSDAGKAARAIAWVSAEIERRKALCGDVDHLANKMRGLYDSPLYKGERLPYIYLMTDENSLLQEAMDERSDSEFARILKIGRAFDVNCIMATQETYQKGLGSRRQLLTPYSFFLPMSQLKLVEIDLPVPNETGVFAYPKDNGGVALAKGFYLDESECAPFIAEQTKKANQTTHRLFRELVARVNQALPDDMVAKVERKLQTSTIGHREPVITGNYREAA